MDLASSLTSDVYFQLHDELVMGLIPPGERLKTVVLAKKFDVSLSAVREALSRLSAEGFVTWEPQRGFRAASISTDDLRHVTDAVVAIESECLQRSIAAGDSAWEARVAAAYQAFCEAPRHTADDPLDLSPAFRQAYSAFRFALVSACQNTVLMGIRQNLMQQSQRHERLCAALGALTPSGGRDYGPLVEQVLARNTAEALDLLKARVTRNSAMFEKALLEDVSKALSGASARGAAKKSA